MTMQTTASFPALVGRLSWMIFGPFFLMALAFHIAGRADAWFDPSDLIYLVILGATFVGRWAEFRLGVPMTASGEPATPELLRRYALGLGLGLWVAANLIGNSGHRIVG